MDKYTSRRWTSAEGGGHVEACSHRPPNAPIVSVLASGGIRLHNGQEGYVLAKMNHDEARWLAARLLEAVLLANGDAQ